MADPNRSAPAASEHVFSTPEYRRPRAKAWQFTFVFVGSSPNRD